MKKFLPAFFLIAALLSSSQARADAVGAVVGCPAGMLAVGIGTAIVTRDLTGSVGTAVFIGCPAGAVAGGLGLSVAEAKAAPSEEQLAEDSGTDAEQ